MTVPSPQLLSEGELAPGLHSDEFAARRAALAAAMPAGSIALLAAAPVNYMVGVIPYPYRQVRRRPPLDRYCNVHSDCKPSHSDGSLLPAHYPRWV